MPQNNWEEIFDEYFEHLRVGAADFTFMDYKNIKKFISQLLKEERAKLLEEIEEKVNKKSMQGNGQYGMGFDDCRDELKSLLNSMK